MNTAAAIAVEIVADLSTLDASLRRAEGNTTRAAGKIANDLGKVERATDRVNTTSIKTSTATERLAASYGRMSGGLNSAASASARLAAANDNVARSAHEASTAARLLSGAIGLINAGAMIALGTAIAKVGMEMAALERGFAASAGSAQQGARELTFVRAEADRLGLSLGETAKQYMQMVAASQGTAMQGQGTRDIFVAISTAMTALGKSAADAGGALNAVQQMMSKGSVQSEELKGQLGERLPGAFNLAAQAMGKTTAEFQKMLEGGEVLAEDLLPKLAAKLIETYGAAAQAGSLGLTANLNRLATAWNEYSNSVAAGGLDAALNRAAQAMTRFLQNADGAASGRALGGAIDEIVVALDRVPRGFENLKIGGQIIADLAREFNAWAVGTSSVSDAASNLAEVNQTAAAATGESWRTGINTVIDAFVTGYEMAVAAWNGLPAAFADVSTRAGNALIGGIEGAVNYLLGLLQKFVNAWNAIGSALPSGLDFPKLADVGKVSFDRLENSSKGAAENIQKDFKGLADNFGKTDYLGKAGDAIGAGVDNLRSRFRVLRADQDATNHLLREAGKIAGENKVADAYKNAAKAGAASKKAAEESGGAAKDATSAYDNLIQRTKDRIEELELEAKYASKTATEVIKLKLAHDLERAAKKDGAAVTDAMRQEWDRLGDSLAAATQKMEAAKLAQQQLKDGLRETAEGLSSLFKDLASGKGFDAAIKSFGARSLDSVIDGLLTGKGQIGVALGLAPTEKGGIGGLLNLDWTKMTKAVEKGSSAGTFSGFANIFGFGDAQQGPTQSGATLDQANRGSALSGLAGIGGAALGAYGAGASGGALVGGLTGAISGAAAGAVFGPVGMAIGAILGAGSGILGASSAAKKAKEERKRQAEAAYEEAKPQFLTLGSQLRGDPQNTLALQIEDARAATRKLTDTAFFANKLDEAHKLYQDFVTYEERIKVDFARAYEGMASNLAAGVGPDSPFAQARDAVKTLGTALKGFIDDTKTVFGEGAPQIQRSTEAARAYAIAVLDGAKSMSTVETRVQEVRGVAAGLQQVLVDLGMAADQAAEAISSGATAALDRLRASFRADLVAEVNEIEGVGYIDEIQKLFQDVAGRRNDASLLGTTNTDGPLIDRYLRGKAQEIVDSAQLTGVAFDTLVAVLPEVSGLVHEFNGALKGAAREADIAARKLAFADRLFNATNDNSTLEGQLAAYNRQAIRERQAEIKAGGEALVELEQAQAAERYNIIRDWNQKTLDEQKRAAEEARSFWQRFAKQIKEYTDGLRAGADSPLSPQARLAAAQSQYNAQLALAQGGDRDAMSGITSYSSDLLDAAKAYYASSTGYQNIFASVIAQLEALPDMVSDTQLIIDAIDSGAQATVDMLAIMKSSLEMAVNSGSAQQIAGALSTYFNKIDTNTSQNIDFAEMQAALGGMASQSALYNMFTRLDTDNSGSLSKLELIKTATDGTTVAVDGQDAWLAAIQTFTQSTNANAASIANAAEVQKASLAAIQSNGYNAWQIAERQHASFGAMLSLLELIRANLASANNRVSIQGNSGAVQGYATGGYVSGPGSATSDSISARLSDGEFVMRAAAVDRFGVGMLDQMNDNFRMPAVAVPMQGGGNGAMVAELRALREEVKALRKENSAGQNFVAKAAATGAQHVREGVDVVASNTAAGARAERRKAAA